MMKAFIRRQEVNLAVKLLKWRYEQSNTTEPPESMLRTHAEQVVDEAHRIAKERGRNVMGIIKELVEEVKKKK
jgi:hypothetical protein